MVGPIPVHAECRVGARTNRLIRLSPEMPNSLAGRRSLAQAASSATRIPSPICSGATSHDLEIGFVGLNRISITTQLVIWFLCLSLVPCVVLTGIISYLSNQSLRKIGASGAAGNRRCQDHPARDLYSRASRRPERGESILRRLLKLFPS